MCTNAPLYHAPMLSPPGKASHSTESKHSVSRNHGDRISNARTDMRPHDSCHVDAGFRRGDMFLFLLGEVFDRFLQPSRIGLPSLCRNERVWRTRVGLPSLCNQLCFEGPRVGLPSRRFAGEKPLIRTGLFPR